MRTASIGMPFAGVPGTLENNRDFPQFPQTVWAEFYYRVKYWRYSMTLATDPEGPFLTWTGNFIGNLATPSGRPLNEQKIYDYSATAGGVNLNGGGDESYRLAWDWSAQPLISATGNYVPLILFTVSPPDVEFGSFTRPPAGLVEQPFTATLMTYPCPKFYADPGYGRFYGSLDWMPQLWWERRRADGAAPVWGATTGSKLLPTPRFDELP